MRLMIGAFCLTAGFAGGVFFDAGGTHDRLGRLERENRQLRADAAETVQVLAHAEAVRAEARGLLTEVHAAIDGRRRAEVTRGDLIPAQQLPTKPNE